MSDPSDFPVSIADIRDAAERLAGLAVHTPLLDSPDLDERVGGRVLLKVEALQRTGSFKFRGAYNCISSLAPQDRERGVVAWSSGNHAQGVAAAARLLRVRATIVMPADAPALKIDNTRSHGAEVVLYDRYSESREEIGAALAEKHGLAIVRPYDDPFVIAGQGTVGLEIGEQCRALGVGLDALIVPCSGGGLSSGCALAMAALDPGTEVLTVEPAGFDDTARSLAAGRRCWIEEGSRTSICDALMAPTPGEVTFPILREFASGGLAVTDDEVRTAMRYAATRLKLVLEPGGACALAAVMSGRYVARGKVVCAVLSGGNVSPEMLSNSLRS